MTLGKLLTLSEPCFYICRKGVLTYALAVVILTQITVASLKRGPGSLSVLYPLCLEQSRLSINFVELEQSQI